MNLRYLLEKSALSLLFLGCGAFALAVFREDWSILRFPNTAYVPSGSFLFESLLLVELAIGSVAYVLFLRPPTKAEEVQDLRGLEFHLRQRRQWSEEGR